MLREDAGSIAGAGYRGVGAQANDRECRPALPQTAKKTSYWLLSFPTLLIIAILCILVILGKDYIKELLLFVESLDSATSSSIFLVLFTSVSFPIFYGYVLLNVAVGYMYGVVRGTAMTSLCAISGIAVAHFTIRKWMRKFIERLFKDNDQFNALMAVISGDQAYRLVFFARLTPIPFGLQNSLFAVSEIRTIFYLAASFVGLLPTQVLFTYMGSTLRSMEEVFSDGNTTTGWIVFSVQITFSAGLAVFILRKAKAELNKAVSEQTSVEAANGSHDGAALTDEATSFDALDSLFKHTDNGFALSSSSARYDSKLTWQTITSPSAGAVANVHALRICT